MQANELRALQAPLKHRYKEDPSTARVTSRAEGVVEGEEITCAVSTAAGTLVAGFHPAAGGDGSKACSADMLLEALVACAGVTMKAVAVAMGIPLERARVIAEGIWDVRGALAVDREAPVGLTDIELTYEIESAAEPRQIEKLVQLTERYCVVAKTLTQPPRLTRRTKISSPAHPLSPPSPRPEGRDV